MRWSIGALALALLVLPSLVPGVAAQSSAPPSSVDWYTAAYVVALDGLETIDMSGEVDVHRLQTRAGVYTADGARREYRQYSAVSREAADAFVAELEDQIGEVVAMTVAQAFPTGLIVSTDVTVDRTSLTRTSRNLYDPPVEFTFLVQVERPLDTFGVEDLTEAKLRAILDAGARLRADFTLIARPGSTNTFTLVPPAGLSFVVPTGSVASPAEDDRSAVIQVDARDATDTLSVPVALRLRSASAPSFTEQDASVRVVLDLKDLDVSVAKAAGGDFGNLLVDVNVEGRLAVLRVPDTLRAGIPSALELDYLSSGGIRLLVQEGVVSDAKIAELDRQLVQMMEDRLSASLGGPVSVTGGIDLASLRLPAGVPVNGNEPILFRTSATFAKPLAGGAPAPQAQTAVSLYTQSLSFPLSRVEGYDTTYRVILPKGLSLLEATSPDADVTTGSEGGREYFEATPRDGSSDVQVQVAITPTFVMSKFWPVVLGAALLLALLIGGPIYAVARARRADREESEP